MIPPSACPLWQPDTGNPTCSGQPRPTLLHHAVGHDHAWFEEDERGYAHPRDPYHRVDVRRAARHVVVRCGDAVVAEAGRPAMLFETALPSRFYLSPDEVRTELFEKSETVSQCPYKGPGQHWHLVIGDTRIEDVAWTLTDPIGDATAIPDWWSFYPDKLAVEVDGERLAGS